MATELPPTPTGATDRPTLFEATHTLVELDSQDELLQPIKNSARIKYTCLDVCHKYIALGASTGSVYIFRRNDLKYILQLSGKDGSVSKVAFSRSCNRLAVVTWESLIVLWELNIEVRKTPHHILTSTTHKDAGIGCLVWDNTDKRVFAGDNRGWVTITNVDSKKPSGLFKLLSEVILKADSSIVQLDFYRDDLLVSTLTRCHVCFTKRKKCSTIGKKLRDGAFGACFSHPSPDGDAVVLSARPGSRIWEANSGGEVLKTHQFKKLLAIPPLPVVSPRVYFPPWDEESSPQSLVFSRLSCIGMRFILAVATSGLYILDLQSVQVIFWTDAVQDTSNMSIYCKDIFILSQSSQHVRKLTLCSIAHAAAKLLRRNLLDESLCVSVSFPACIKTKYSRSHLPIHVMRDFLQLLEKEKKDNEMVKNFRELLTEIEVSCSEDNVSIDAVSVASSQGSTDSSESSIVRLDSGIHVIRRRHDSENSVGGQSDFPMLRPESSSIEELSEDYTRENMKVDSMEENKGVVLNDKKEDANSVSDSGADASLLGEGLHGVGSNAGHGVDVVDLGLTGVSLNIAVDEQDVIEDDKVSVSSNPVEVSADVDSQKAGQNDKSCVSTGMVGNSLAHHNSKVLPDSINPDDLIEENIKESSGPEDMAVSNFTKCDSIVDENDSISRLDSKVLERFNIPHAEQEEICSTDGTCTGRSKVENLNQEDEEEEEGSPFLSKDTDRSNNVSPNGEINIGLTMENTLEKKMSAKEKSGHFWDEPGKGNFVEVCSTSTNSLSNISSVEILCKGNFEEVDAVLTNGRNDSSTEELVEGKFAKEIALSPIERQENSSSTVSDTIDCNSAFSMKTLDEGKFKDVNTPIMTGESASPLVEQDKGIHMDQAAPKAVQEKEPSSGTLDGQILADSDLPPSLSVGFGGIVELLNPVLNPVISQVVLNEDCQLTEVEKDDSAQNTDEQLVQSANKLPSTPEEGIRPSVQSTTFHSGVPCPSPLPVLSQDLEEEQHQISNVDVLSSNMHTPKHSSIPKIPDVVENKEENKEISNNNNGQGNHLSYPEILSPPGVGKTDRNEGVLVGSESRQAAEESSAAEDSDLLSFKEQSAKENASSATFPERPEDLSSYRTVDVRFTKSDVQGSEVDEVCFVSHVEECQRVESSVDDVSDEKIGKGKRDMVGDQGEKDLISTQSPGQEKEGSKDNTHAKSSSKENIENMFKTFSSKLGRKKKKAQDRPRSLTLGDSKEQWKSLTNDQEKQNVKVDLGNTKSGELLVDGTVGQFVNDHQNNNGSHISSGTSISTAQLNGHARAVSDDIHIERSLSIDQAFSESQPLSRSLPSSSLSDFEGDLFPPWIPEEPVRVVLKPKEKPKKLKKSRKPRVVEIGTVRGPATKGQPTQQGHQTPGIPHLILDSQAQVPPLSSPSLSPHTPSTPSTPSSPLAHHPKVGAKVASTDRSDSGSGRDSTKSTAEIKKSQSSNNIAKVGKSFKTVTKSLSQKLNKSPLKRFRSLEPPSPSTQEEDARLHPYSSQLKTLTEATDRARSQLDNTLACENSEVALEALKTWLRALQGVLDIVISAEESKKSGKGSEVGPAPSSTLNSGGQPAPNQSQDGADTSNQSHAREHMQEPVNKESAISQSSTSVGCVNLCQNGVVADPSADIESQSDPSGNGLEAAQRGTGPDPSDQTRTEPVNGTGSENHVKLSSPDPGGNMVQLDEVENSALTDKIADSCGTTKDKFDPLRSGNATSDPVSIDSGQSFDDAALRSDLLITRTPLDDTSALCPSPENVTKDPQHLESDSLTNAGVDVKPGQRSNVDSPSVTLSALQSLDLPEELYSQLSELAVKCFEFEVFLIDKVDKEGLKNGEGEIRNEEQAVKENDLQDEKSGDVYKNEASVVLDHDSQDDVDDGKTSRGNTDGEMAAVSPVIPREEKSAKSNDEMSKPEIKDLEVNEEKNVEGHDEMSVPEIKDLKVLTGGIPAKLVTSHMETDLRTDVVKTESSSEKRITEPDPAEPDGKEERLLPQMDPAVAMEMEIRRDQLAGGFLLRFYPLLDSGQVRGIIGGWGHKERTFECLLLGEGQTSADPLWEKTRDWQSTTVNDAFIKQITALVVEKPVLVLACLHRIASMSPTPVDMVDVLYQCYPYISFWEAIQILRVTTNCHVNIINYVTTVTNSSHQVSRNSFFTSELRDLSLRRCVLSAALSDQSPDRPPVICSSCKKEPIPLSNMAVWSHHDLITAILKISQPHEHLQGLLEECYHQGYWLGVIRLLKVTGQRQSALEVVLSLADHRLLQHAAGVSPQSFVEWHLVFHYLQCNSSVLSLAPWQQSRKCCLTCLREIPSSSGFEMKTDLQEAAEGTVTEQSCDQSNQSGDQSHQSCEQSHQSHDPSASLNDHEVSKSGHDFSGLNGYFPDAILGSKERLPKSGTECSEPQQNGEFDQSERLTMHTKLGDNGYSRDDSEVTYRETTVNGMSDTTWMEMSVATEVRNKHKPEYSTLFDVQNNHSVPTKEKDNSIYSAEIPNHCNSNRTSDVAKFESSSNVDALIEDFTFSHCESSEGRNGPSWPNDDTNKGESEYSTDVNELKTNQNRPSWLNNNDTNKLVSEYARDVNKLPTNQNGPSGLNNSDINKVVSEYSTDGNELPANHIMHIGTPKASLEFKLEEGDISNPERVINFNQAPEQVFSKDSESSVGGGEISTELKSCDDGRIETGQIVSPSKKEEGKSFARTANNSETNGGKESLNDEKHSASSPKRSDWTAQDVSKLDECFVTWECAATLLLESVGPSSAVKVLQAYKIPECALSRDFFRKCLQRATVEARHKCKFENGQNDVMRIAVHPLLHQQIERELVDQRSAIVGFLCLVQELIRCIGGDKWILLVTVRCVAGRYIPSSLVSVFTLVDMFITKIAHLVTAV